MMRKFIKLTETLFYQRQIISTELMDIKRRGLPGGASLMNLIVYTSHLQRSRGIMLRETIISQKTVPVLVEMDH